MKIIILQGLPGSGKTTWAKSFCQINLNYVRINRDDLRNMSGKYWVPSRESYITSLEQTAVSLALEAGYNVILDSTNFNDKVHAWVQKIAETFLDTEVEVKFFDVSVKECIKRDSKRESPVGEEVIINMAKKYLDYD